MLLGHGARHDGGGRRREGELEEPVGVVAGLLEVVQEEEVVAEVETEEVAETPEEETPDEEASEE